MSHSTVLRKAYTLGKADFQRAFQKIFPFDISKDKIYNKKAKKLENYLQKIH